MSKKLIIISFLVVSLVFGTVPVLASETTSEDVLYASYSGVGFLYNGEMYYFDDEIASISENYNASLMRVNSYYIIMYFYDDASTEEVTECYAGSYVVDYTSYYALYFSEAGTYDDFYVVCYDLSDLSLSYHATNAGDYFESMTPIKSYDELYDSIVFSSRTLYKQNGDLFFQAVPLPPLVQLQKIVKNLDLIQVMTELIGVLPLVIGLAVFCLGLRKGWNLLVATLHKA